MAKTLANIISDTRQHISQTDSTNSQFTDAQLTIWINDAYRQIVSTLRHLPIKERDYTVSSLSVTLNSNTVTVDTVLLKNPDRLNSDGSAKYDELQVLSLDQLIAYDPDYQAATSDFPKYFCRKGTFTMVLYPPPKASVIAQTTPLRTYGLELPTELSATTDTPDLPGNLHDIISHWPAYRCFSQLENQIKATEHIQLFNSGVKSQKGISVEFSKKKKGFSWGEVCSEPF